MEGFLNNTKNATETLRFLRDQKNSKVINFRPRHITWQKLMSLLSIVPKISKNPNKILDFQKSIANP
jgi:hypothetical protein